MPFDVGVSPYFGTYTNNRANDGAFIEAPIVRGYNVQSFIAAQAPEAEKWEPHEYSMSHPLSWFDPARRAPRRGPATRRILGVTECFRSVHFAVC